MGRTPPHKCGLCSDLVLGVLGQDGFLPAYATGDQLDLLKDAGALGWVHAKCLLEGGWAELWTRLWLNLRTKVPGTISVYQGKTSAVLLHSATGDRIVVSNGVDVRITKSSAIAETVMGKELIPLAHEFNLDLGSHTHIAKVLRTRFESDSRIKMLEMVDLFNLRRRLVQPKALADGWIGYLPNEAATTRAELVSHSLCGWAEYGLMVDDTEARLGIVSSDPSSREYDV